MYKVIIFGYNFKHKKSEDFIHILEKNSIKIVAFIGANKVKLNLNKKIYNKNISQSTIYHPKQLCKKYNIHFFESIHNSENVKRIIINTKANLGIISGARIISNDIIDLFKHGIVNFHPGSIPLASGLDGLFWSIYKGIGPYVTTHLIDKRIDAGKIIFGKKVAISIDDRIEDIQNKILLIENEELEKLCINFLKKDIKIQSKPVDNYISFNGSMCFKKQKIVLNKFEEWKKKIIYDSEQNAL
jgi:methionyl-tRNA formyltransferase